MTGRGFGQRLTRLRARAARDPYNPRRSVATWETPDSAAFCGFIATQASSVDGDGAREQEVATATLTVLGDADIRKGDRVTDGVRTWLVYETPRSDTNPFTGWKPGIEVYLREVHG